MPPILPSSRSDLASHQWLFGISPNLDICYSIGPIYRKDFAQAIGSVLTSNFQCLDEQFSVSWRAIAHLDIFFFLQITHFLYWPSFMFYSFAKIACRLKTWSIIHLILMIIMLFSHYLVVPPFDNSLVFGNYLRCVPNRKYSVYFIRD